MRLAITIVLALLSAVANSQQSPPEAQLPDWAAKKLSVLVRSVQIEVDLRLNPFVWRGDFDGDGHADLAVWVRKSKSKKEGIAFLFSGARESVVLGAGKSFGNGGDDFSWVDFWYAEDKGSFQQSYYEKSLTLKADGISVVKEGSASALIFFKAGRAVWQQQGD